MWISALNISKRGRFNVHVPPTECMKVNNNSYLTKDNEKIAKSSGFYFDYKEFTSKEEAFAYYTKRLKEELEQVEKARKNLNSREEKLTTLLSHSLEDSAAED